MTSTDEPRTIIALDSETSGLDAINDYVVEISWHNLSTGERETFIPPHPVDQVLRWGAPEALQINGYRERIEHAKQDTGKTYESKVWKLKRQLEGATILGSKPTFDMGFLSELFDRCGMSEPKNRAPWHHHPIDIGAYGMGVLNLDEMPSQKRLCELLEIEPGQHTAESDVAALVSCWYRLRAMRNGFTLIPAPRLESLVA